VFHRHQDRYLFPVINDKWKEEEADVISDLASKAVISLNGDGRCDSPGPNAKYSTNTMMDSEFGTIINCNLVQVTEDTSSNAMVTEGFLRCVNDLQGDLTITHIVTDRHPSSITRKKVLYKNTDLVSQYNYYYQDILLSHLIFGSLGNGLVRN